MRASRDARTVCSQILLEQELETESQVTLRDQPAARVGSADDSEVAIGDSAIRIAEVRVVQRVEGFSAELQFDPLTNGEGPEDAHVEVEVSRSTQ